MAGEQFRAARKSALEVVGLQALIALLAGAVAWAAAGRWAGLSALTGGAIGALATLMMVMRMFLRGPMPTAREWMAGMLIGELMKFGVTVVLFAVAVVVFKAAFLPLILAYIATYMAYWAGLLRISFGRTA